MFISRHHRLKSTAKSN